MPAQGRTSGSADTSQVIVDAATRLFHHRGFHGTSIRDIHRQCEHPMELRCPEPPLRDAVVARHSDVHELFSAPIADGVASGTLAPAG